MVAVESLSPFWEVGEGKAMEVVVGGTPRPFPVKVKRTGRTVQLIDVDVWALCNRSQLKVWESTGGIPKFAGVYARGDRVRLRAVAVEYNDFDEHNTVVWRRSSTVELVRRGRPDLTAGEKERIPAWRKASLGGPARERFTGCVCSAVAPDGTRVCLLIKWQRPEVHTNHYSPETSPERCGVCRHYLRASLEPDMAGWLRDQLECRWRHLVRADGAQEGGA